MQSVQMPQHENAMEAYNWRDDFNTVRHYQIVEYGPHCPDDGAPNYVLIKISDDYLRVHLKNIDYQRIVREASLIPPVA